MFLWGFLVELNTPYVWTKHGERGIVLDNNIEEEDRIPEFGTG